MEHRLRRKGFENTIFCIAVVKLACTEATFWALLGSGSILFKLVHGYLLTKHNHEPHFCVLRSVSACFFNWSDVDKCMDFDTEIRAKVVSFFLSTIKHD